MQHLKTSRPVSRPPSVTLYHYKSKRAIHCTALLSNMSASVDNRQTKKARVDGEKVKLNSS